MTQLQRLPPTPVGYSPKIDRFYGSVEPGCRYLTNVRSRTHCPYVGEPCIRGIHPWRKTSHSTSRAGIWCEMRESNPRPLVGSQLRYRYANLAHYFQPMKITLRSLLKDFQATVDAIERIAVETFAAIHDEDGSILCVATTPTQWTSIGGDPFARVTNNDFQTLAMDRTKVSDSALRSRQLGGEAAGYYNLIRTYRPLKGIVDQRTESNCSVPVGGGGDYFQFIAYEPGANSNAMSLEVVNPGAINSPLLLVTSADGLRHKLYPATDGTGAITTTSTGLLAFADWNGNLIRFAQGGNGSGGPIPPSGPHQFSNGTGVLPRNWPVMEITKNGKTVLWLTTKGHVDWLIWPILDEV